MFGRFLAKRCFSTDTERERPFLRRSLNLLCTWPSAQFSLHFVPLHQNETSIVEIASLIKDQQPKGVFVPCGPNLLFKSIKHIMPIDQAVSANNFEDVYVPVLNKCHELKLPVISVGVDDAQIFNYHVRKGYQDNAIMPNDLGSGRVDKWSEEEEVEVMKKEASGLYQSLVYDRSLFSFYNLLYYLRSRYGPDIEEKRRLSPESLKRLEFVDQFAAKRMLPDSSSKCQDDRCDQYIVVTSARIHEVLCEMCDQGLPQGDLVPIDPVLMSNMDLPVSLFERVSKKMMFIFPISLLLGGISFSIFKVGREWIKGDAVKHREMLERRRFAIQERNKLRDKVAGLHSKEDRE